MEVLHYLGTKAAVSICVCSALHSFNNGLSYPVEFIIIFVGALVLMMTMTINRKRHLGLICVSVILLVLLSAAISQSNLKRDLQFYEDNVWPYFQYRNTLNWCCQECFNVYIFICRLIAVLSIRPLHFFAYICYLLINAIVFLFIFEIIVINIPSFIYFTISGNFFYSFDVNNTKDYPEGYFNSKDLDKTLYRFPVVHTQLYNQDLTGKFVLVANFEHSISEQKHKFPLFHRSVERYLGEDVTLICSYTRKTLSNKKSKTFWSLNGNHISRYLTRYIMEDEEVPNNDIYTIKSKLTIKVLRSSDFGDYECRAPSTFYHDDKTYKWTPKQLVKFKVIIGVITLKEICPKTILLNREVGNLIATQAFFWYHTGVEISEVSVEYTINNKAMDLLCSGYSTFMCSFGARLLKMFKTIGTSNLKWDGEENFPYIDVAELYGYPDMKRAIVYYCLFPQAFGIHRINFIRYVNIPGTKKGYFEYIQHPYVFVVLPHSKLSLFRYIDDSAVYAELENLVRTEQPIELIEMKVDAIIGLLSANEEKVLVFANIVQNLLFAGIFVLLVLLGVFLSKVYFVLLLRKPSRRFLRALPYVQQKLMLEYPVIDVFISHSEEERSFVTDIIVPFLEEEFGIKTCFSGSNEFKPNQPLIRQLFETITQSSKILVVLSKGFHEDILCEQLQLEHIILPLLYEERRHKTHILFILYNDGARFPEILRWNFDAQRLRWNNHLPVRVLLGSIRKWITTGNV